MKNVFIIGSDSFVGNAIAKNLKSRGYMVTGGSRRPIEKRNTENYSKTIYFDFSNVEENFDFSSFDLIIHAAFDPDERTFDVQIRATQKIIHENLSQKHLLISSIAATTSNMTTYGEMKKKLEDLFLQEGKSVIRLGLVIGNGGLFGVMIDQMKKYPVIPLIGGGHQKVYYVGINDATKKITDVIENSDLQKKIVNIWYEEPIEQKDLIKQVKRMMHLHCILVPVPTNMILAPIVILERLNVDFPVKSNNVRGLNRNSVNHLKTDLGPAQQKSFPEYLKENIA